MKKFHERQAFYNLTEYFPATKKGCRKKKTFLRQPLFMDSLQSKNQNLSHHSSAIIDAAVRETSSHWAETSCVAAEILRM